MSTNAFTQLGNTVTFTAALTAPTPVQALSNTLGGNQYRIINTGNVIVIMGYGLTVSTATSNTITPPSFSIPLLPGTDEILTFVPNAYFTGITASGNAIVYITPGDGM
jgi:hypothetical protein